jgi:NADH dehydrogenase FAD-containing subunit
VQGRVTNIDPVAKTVTVSGSGNPLSYDLLVLAPGSTYALPCKASAPNAAESRATLSSLRAGVQAADTVVIMGGGPVGVEAAAEVKSAHPSKRVVLVHSGRRLLDNAACNGYLTKAFCDRAAAKLTTMGVEVVLNQKATTSAAPVEGAIVGKHSVSFGGQAVESGFTLVATGTKPNTAWLKDTGIAGSLTDSGFVKVAGTFQVEGFPDIYCLGDATARAEAKTAYIIATVHAPAVVKNILATVRARSNGTEPRLSTYTLNQKPVMILSLGKNDGVGLMPNKKGRIIESTLVKMLKSKGLFISKTASSLGYKVGQY